MSVFSEQSNSAQKLYLKSICKPIFYLSSLIPTIANYEGTEEKRKGTWRGKGLPVAAALDKEQIY